VAYQLDGTDNQDPILGIIVINPPLDAISDTKITTQNFDAEFGKAVASFISAQTKSGSNSFSRQRIRLSREQREPRHRSLYAVCDRNRAEGRSSGTEEPVRRFDRRTLHQKTGYSASSIIRACGKKVGNVGYGDRSDGAPRIEPVLGPTGCDFSEYATGHPGQHHCPSGLPADVGWIGAVSGQRNSGLAALPAGSGSAELLQPYASECGGHGCSREAEWFERQLFGQRHRSL